MHPSGGYPDRPLTIRRCLTMNVDALKPRPWHTAGGRPVCTSGASVRLSTPSGPSGGRCGGRGLGVPVGDLGTELVDLGGLTGHEQLGCGVLRLAHREPGL